MANLNKALVAATALLLAACNGSNVVDRTSNPTKPYQGAIDRSQPWRPGMKPVVQPKDADNRQFYCGNDVFRLTVNGDPGLRRAVFHADVEGVFELKIETQTKTSFKVTKVGGPRALQLRSLGDVTRYQLVWKPSREDQREDQVKIVITDEELNKTCQFRYADLINIVVDPGPGAPVLDIKDLPTTALEYSEVPLKFTVVIHDPAGTADRAPVISEVGADERAISNPESRQVNVSAQGAVTCEDGQSRGERAWVFTCSFLMSKLPNLDYLKKSEQTINAVFFVKGKSLATALDAPQASAAVQVHFPGPPKDVKPEVAPTRAVTTGVPGQKASSTDVAADPKPKAKARVRKSSQQKKKQRAAAAAKAGATT